MLAVNNHDAAAQSATMAALGDLPLLQDSAAVDAWGAWQVAYRDVVILDADNRVLVAYNLTANDLGDPANYAALKALLEDALTP